MEQGMKNLRVTTIIQVTHTAAHLPLPHCKFIVVSVRSSAQSSQVQHPGYITTITVIITMYYFADRYP
jgi:hypothetical protein